MSLSNPIADGDCPQVIIVAGPNGAGKSTTSRFLLEPQFSLYINPDLIATGMSPQNPESVSFATGRIVLTRIRELIALREDFAFETTLSGKTYLNLIRKMKTKGYRVHLIFLWLENADLAVQRVKARVRAGGHHIPEDTVRRRYAAGLRNFFRLYKDEVDEWRFYGNSTMESQLIATQSYGVLQVEDCELWKQISAEYGLL